MVFVRAVHALQQLNEVELEIYDSWFNPMLDWQPELVPDGFVYLKTDAATCARRIQMRKRHEEAGVPLDYLERLHGLHDRWLVGGGNVVGQQQHGMVLGQPKAVTSNTLFPAGMIYSLKLHVLVFLCLFMCIRGNTSSWYQLKTVRHCCTCVTRQRGRYHRT